MNLSSRIKSYSKIALLLVLFLLIIPSNVNTNQFKANQTDDSIRISGGTDAQLDIVSVSDSTPICGNSITFDVDANHPDAKDYSIPVRLYCDVDLNDDGTAFDDVMGELRFIYYGSGKFDYTIPCNSFFEPGMRTFTVVVEEQGSLFHGSDSIQVEIVETPTITFISPEQEGLYGIEPPEIEVEFTADQVDTTSYKITNNSVLANEVEWTTWQGNVNQDLWDGIGNGSVSIIFRVIDTSNNAVAKTFKLRKDIIKPLITEVWIEEGKEYRETSPEFQILIEERNLASAWYTLNDGNKQYIENVPYRDWLCQNISQALWDTIPAGTVKISFYALDKVGNSASHSVSIKKTIQASSTGVNNSNNETTGNGTKSLDPFSIPGYQIDYLFGVTALLIVIATYGYKSRKK